MTGKRDWSEWLLIAVAIITILSGVVQIVVPDSALAVMQISATNETIYLFRLVSLLTALFGGALLHTALSGRYERTVVLWAGLQKLLGAGAVFLAVLSRFIASGTLLVAGYDFAAGLYIVWFYYRRR